MGPAEKLETTPERSKLMSKIRSRDTKPELLLRDILESLGFMYQPTLTHGNPDFASVENPQTAVFVDGCFWHGCPWHYKAPKANADFWRRKHRRNTKNDLKVDEELTSEHWLVVRVWEHSLTAENAEYIGKVINLLRWAHTEKENLKVVRI